MKIMFLIKKKLLDKIIENYKTFFLKKIIRNYYDNALYFETKMIPILLKI